MNRFANTSVQRLKGQILRLLRPAVSKLAYTSRSGLAKGMRRRGGLGFLPGRGLTADEQFLLGLNFRGLTVFDIGGWEGVYTMFFSRAVGETGHVVTFEPNPINQDRIAENVRLNGLSNVTVRPVALGEYVADAELLIPAGVSGEAYVATSASRDSLPGGSTRMTIRVTTGDDEMRLNRLPVPDFVKIDVEGFELNVLRGMRNTIEHYKPRLFIELHHTLNCPRQNAELITWLLKRNYALQHVESGRQITNPDYELEHSDHLYCEQALGAEQKTSDDG